MEILDRPLFKTLQTLPPFPFAQLVRPDLKSVRLSRDAFLTNRTLPQFTYERADRFDAKAYEQALNAVEDRISSIPALESVRALYHEKILETRTRLHIITAIQKHDAAAVSANADHLFGNTAQSEQELTDEASDMLARAHELHTHRDRIDTELFTHMVRTTLNYYDLHHWTIRPTSRASVSILHGNDDQSAAVKIPKKFVASRARAARLLTHEIEVHALRTHNGFTSPITLLGVGLAGYIATDEGLAVATQQKLRAEESMDPGFWDAWASVLTQGHDFTSTFDVLYDARRKLNIAMNIPDADVLARDTAWRLMVRVSRGIHTPGDTGIGYRRDHIYRSGLVTVRQAIETHGESAILPTLFAGHAGIHHIPVLQSLGIRGRIPDLISKRIVKEVLADHRKKKKAP